METGVADTVQPLDTGVAEYEPPAALRIGLKGLDHRYRRLDVPHAEAGRVHRCDLPVCIWEMTLVLRNAGDLPIVGTWYFTADTGADAGGCTHAARRDAVSGLHVHVFGPGAQYGWFEGWAIPKPLTTYLTASSAAR